MSTAFWCEVAWLGGDAPTSGVVVEVADGRIAAVSMGVAEPPVGAIRLDGLTLPGMANAHSHAFHRALRGRTQAGTGSFWTWRDQMYAVAQRLEPDSYRRLARAVFGEMALAGTSVVGEFHYVHHRPDGTPYGDPNAMGIALVDAAADAGIRITLLDTCYLHGGLDDDGYGPLGDHQKRFGDGTTEAWETRVDDLVGLVTDRPGALVGAAVHSVRAVDPQGIATVAAWSERHDAPVHVHLSEQPAENEACLAHHGSTPTALLAGAGLLGPRCTAVHATHLTDDDVAQLGGSATCCCFCPSTERDLADGIGPAAALRTAGSTISLGSDSHAVVDPFEEARAVELDERLASGVRGTHTVADLATMATGHGHRSLGWPDAGRLETGMRADLTTVGLGSVRLAGTGPDTALAAVVFAATAADVHHVVVDGRVVVRDGGHVSMDVATELAAAISEVTGS